MNDDNGQIWLKFLLTIIFTKQKQDKSRVIIIMVNMMQNGSASECQTKLKMPFTEPVINW